MIVRIAGSDVVFTAELECLGTIQTSNWNASDNAKLLLDLGASGHIKVPSVALTLSV